eukprot:234644-Chlamydomonas_euryale.AAC.2
MKLADAELHVINIHPDSGKRKHTGFNIPKVLSAKVTRCCQPMSHGIVSQGHTSCKHSAHATCGYRAWLWQSM